MWGAILIPVIALFILYFFFEHKIHPVEYCLQLFAPIVLIFLCWLGSTSYRTADIEYWGGWITDAVYEEPWNEYIHKTCSYEVSCGKDCTQTIYYDCSYVEEHGPKYYFNDSNGEWKYITSDDYAYLVNKFGNRVKTGHHSGYTRSGDIFTTSFNGERKRLETTTSIRMYQNRVQASSTIMNFPEISKKEAKELGLYEYPAKYTHMWHTSSVLGGYCQEFDDINAVYGASLKIRIWVLLFDDKNRYIVQDQINYWKNGNKNELVLCIGTKNGIIQWSDVFTWADCDQFRLEIRDKMVEGYGKPLNLPALARWLEPKITEGWKKKNWHDFDYLRIEPTTTYIVITYIVTIFSTCSIAVFCIMNDLFKEDNINYNDSKGLYISKYRRRNVKTRPV